MRRIAKGQEPPWEIAQVLSGFNLAFTDEPPFVVEWMFAVSDVPWLMKLRDRLRQDHADAMRERAPLDSDGKDRAFVELLPQYQQVLRTVARARWESDPELRGFLADSRLLKDIPRDSDQYRWLSGVLNQVGPGILWVGQEWAQGRDFPSDYLAATDLPALVRLGNEGLAAIGQTKMGTTAEEVGKLVRPQAEAFYYGIVKQRLPD